MLLNRYRSAFERLRSVLKPALTFEFWSTLVLMVSFAPASGWLLNRLVASSGQFAVSDNDLIAFFLSLQGILFLICSIGFILTFWFAEQVGLLIIAVKATSEKHVRVGVVLWEQLSHFPALIRLGLLQAAGYIAASIPFVLGLGLVYWLLLREFDIYFYVNVQPLSWWIALALGATLIIAYLVLATWLYVRWLFAIPLLVFEGASPWGALKQSWQQTRERFRKLTVPLLVWWAGVLISSVIMTWLVRSCASWLLEHAGLTLKVVLPAVIGTLALVAILDILWLIIGKTVHVMLMADFYRETTDEKPARRTTVPSTRMISLTAFKRLGWLMVIIALVIGGSAGAAFLQGFNIAPEIAITGHRGSKVKAPENTLSALQQAIAEGADYAEIDVMTTADGVVVLFHDADLMRVASVNRRLRDILYHELHDIDVGSWFAPEFSNERIPTLQQAIDLARGRIKLNIELKFTWPDPTLAAKVGNIIRQNNFAANCVVSSLNYQSLTEIKEKFPELIAGFIVFQVAGNLPRMEADFLSLNAARATPRLVRQIHRQGRAVHVWTVNDFNNVISMIERGVDNIITDYPQNVRSYLKAWNALSGYEKILLMLRNLIVDIESPVPSDL